MTINIGKDTPLAVLDAINGGVDGKQGMGESQGANNPLGPLGDLMNQLGGLGGLMKIAGPILGAIGI